MNALQGSRSRTHADRLVLAYTLKKTKPAESHLTADGLSRRALAEKAGGGQLLLVYSITVYG